jgi:hypothetical protein
VLRIVVARLVFEVEPIITVIASKDKRIIIFIITPNTVTSNRGISWNEDQTVFDSEQAGVAMSLFDTWNTCGI